MKRQLDDPKPLVETNKRRKEGAGGEIPALISELNRAQKGGDTYGIIKNTHFERKVSKELTEDNKVLDSMARLIGGLTVSAVCYDGEKFLVSANDRKVETAARDYFKYFSNIGEKEEDLKRKAYKTATETWNKPVGRQGKPRKDITYSKSS